MDERLTQLEDKQMDVMMRLNNLSLEVEALRNKTEQNRQMAKDAKALANNATQLASSLEQVRMWAASFCFCLEKMWMFERKQILWTIAVFLLQEIK